MTDLPVEPPADFEDEGDENASTSPDVVDSQNPEDFVPPEPDLPEEEA